MLTGLFGKYLDRDAGLGILAVSSVMFIFAVIFSMTAYSIIMGDQSTYATEIKVYGSDANLMIAANGIGSLAACFFIYKFFIAGMAGIRYGFIAYGFVAALICARLFFAPAFFERATETLILMASVFIGLIVIGFLKLKNRNAE